MRVCRSGAAKFFWGIEAYYTPPSELDVKSKHGNCQSGGACTLVGGNTQNLPREDASQSLNRFPRSAEVMLCDHLLPFANGATDRRPRDNPTHRLGAVPRQPRMCFCCGSIHDDSSHLQLEVGVSSRISTARHAGVIRQCGEGRGWGCGEG